MKTKVYIAGSGNAAYCDLDWNLIGAELVGFSPNGRVAVEEIKRLTPNILITDIDLPEIDGFEISTILETAIPDIYVVIHTGNHSFELAQKAVEHNIRKYLVKQSDPATLLDSIKELSERVRRRRKRTLTAEQFSKNLRKNKIYLKNLFFNVIATSKNDEQIRENLTALGFELHAGVLMVVVIEFENIPGAEVSASVLHSIFLRLNKIPKMKFIPFLDGTMFTYVFSGAACKDFLQDILAVADKIKNSLDSFHSGNYTIAIGTQVNAFRDIPASYQGAQNALRYKLYLGYNKVIYIRDVEPFKITDDYKILADSEYINSIKAGDEATMRDIISKIFTDFKANREKLDTVKRICLELMVYTGRALYELGENPSMLFKQTDVWSLINRYSTIDELFDFITNINSVVIFQINKHRNNKDMNVIERAKEIIELNMSSNLTLEAIAKQVYLSPSYLSFIFSKETNMTFKEYLIACRVDKAKLMLANHEYKIYEVAKHVGYTDARYFSDIFKRSTGMSPRQYRKCNGLLN